MKILLVQRELREYRIPLFKLLAANSNLSIICSGNMSSYHENVKVVKLYSFFGLYWFYGLTKEVLKSDKLIIEGNMRILQIFFLCFIYRTPLVLWGMWPSKSRIVRIFQRFLLRSNRVTPIFYSELHKHQFDVGGQTNPNACVANNTVGITVDRVLNLERNDEFCFIGSLNARKRLDILFRTMSILKSKGYSYKLQIIGDGPEESSLRSLARALDIESNIVWHGRLERDSQIASVIEKSRFSVSVGQAGLSVLHSMAYGTPVLTMESAISGGETFNIINGLNGFKCRNENELIYRMEEMLQGKHDDMYAITYKYYKSNASQENWLNVFENALKISN